MLAAVEVMRAPYRAAPPAPSSEVRNNEQSDNDGLLLAQA
jgi:hypothetical protein